MKAISFVVGLLSCVFCVQRATGAEPTSAQTQPEVIAPADVFGPFREWWYHGAMRPGRESAAMQRLKQYLQEQPTHPEALWWASRLPQAQLLDPPIESIELLMRAADGKHPAAMAHLGSILLTGDGIAPDVDRGWKLLRDAHALSEPEAALAMGIATLKGHGDISINREKAKQLLEEAMQLGTIRAHFPLANLYDSAGDEQAALGELVRGATAGDVRCMESLAEVYRDGRLGQAPEPKQAVEWTRRAAEHGHSAMQRELAKHLLSGYAGLEPDPNLARRLILAAAAGKDREAMLMLARGRVLGEYGFPRDGAKAGKLFDELCDMNDAAGMYTLARFYLDGVVGSKHLSKAEADRRVRQLMQNAAKLGYAPAIEYLKSTAQGTELSH